MKLKMNRWYFVVAIVVIYFTFKHFDGPEGRYCRTVAVYGCPSGYSIVELRSNGTAIEMGIENTIYGEGTWYEVDGGIQIHGLRNAGTYYLKEHIHGRGVGKPGKVYSLNSGTHLFPL